MAKLLFKNARCAVLDFGGSYYAEKARDIYINGELYVRTNLCIFTLHGLKPDSDYAITAENGDMTERVEFRTDYEFVTLNVLDFGAKGDGETDDTVFIQAAVYACPKDSRVLIPAGKYRITSLFLKSGVNIEIAENAVIIADKERYSHPILPGMTESYDEKSEYNLGTWEGNPLPMFAGIICGIDVVGCTIYGKGLIDGNASHDDWWYDEKTMRGAFRPRLLFLERCDNIAVIGVSFKESPSWTIHPYFSENLQFYGLNITNPMNSPNTDGMDIESCRNVTVRGIDFTLGDDCVAVKSGKIYMAKKYGVPAENITISNCLMKNGHGAVTLGSEMSAGIKNLTVENCVFSHTDRGLRIKTRRGRGKDAIIDGVTFRNIKMDNVLTPFVVNCFYFCDPDGRTAYVQNREALPVDERTPYIDELSFNDIVCTDCHYAAAYFLGLPERKIGRITMKNITVSFAENAQKGVAAMHCGAEELCRAGILAENIDELVLDNVNISGYSGERIIARDVGKIIGEG